jgi:RNA recognition motif-containing protein
LKFNCIFEQFDVVMDAVVIMDQVQQRSRGFGILTFDSMSNFAQHAIAAQPLSIQGRHVEVKLATPKGDQKRLPNAGGPRNVNPRARMGTSTGEFAGLAAVYR